MRDRALRARAPPRSINFADLASADYPDGLGAELRRVVNDAAIVRWALPRESRRPGDPLRVIRIYKTDTIYGYFGVPAVPEMFGLRDGVLLLSEEGAMSPHAGTARIHAVFDRSDLESVSANKGETLVEYTYERRGEPVTPEKKNFFPHAEPYSTQFRPVFTFEANARAVARLSHIGRHGGPTLALILYRPCRVYLDRQNPEQAIVPPPARPR